MLHVWGITSGRSSITEAGLNLLAVQEQLNSKSVYGGAEAQPR